MNGLWLTLYYLLHTDYQEYWQPLTWNTKLKTSSGFANIAQLLSVAARPSGSYLGLREGAQNTWTSKWLDRLRVKPENTEMLISPSSSWTNTWPTSWSFWSFGTAHTHLWHFGSFRPCVVGDNQRTSNLFLMLSPETMELERVSGVNAENPMHGHQIKSANSIGFVVDLCWSMLTYWQDLRGWFGTVYRLQICPTFAA